MAKRIITVIGYLAIGWGILALALLILGPFLSPVWAGTVDGLETIVKGVVAIIIGIGLLRRINVFRLVAIWAFCVLPTIAVLHDYMLGIYISMGGETGLSFSEALFSVRTLIMLLALAVYMLLFRLLVSRSVVDMFKSIS